jgi:hypothetical protein
MCKNLIPLTEGMKQEAIPDQLEQLIDSVGLSPVLDAIAIICHGKAGHIATSWQCMVEAKRWERAGALVAKVASKVDL